MNTLFLLINSFNMQMQCTRRLIQAFLYKKTQKNLLISERLIRVAGKKNIYSSPDD